MAARRGVVLDASMHPATPAYCDFLLALTYSGYPAQITAIWALERTYLESWEGARPGAQPYREFVKRWTTDGLRSYVGDLQSSVDRQLEASVGEQAREAEDAFFWVTHYERGFWDMAMSGYSCGRRAVERRLSPQSELSRNRDGNRDANRALHVICVVRLRRHQPTRDYLARRTAEGKTKAEIMRCLKRYIAREVYRAVQESGPETIAPTQGASAIEARLAPYHVEDDPGPDTRVPIAEDLRSPR